MTRSYLTLVTLAGLSFGGVLVHETLFARTIPSEIVEQEVNKNLLRVRVHGKWEEVPLVPLADSLCKSGDEHFERYCQ